MTKPNQISSPVNAPRTPPYKIAGLVLLLVAAVVGIPAGLLIGINDTVDRATRPVVQFLRMISPLSWAPISVALFGIGNQPVIFLIAAAAVWPILINTAAGVHAILRRAREAVEREVARRDLVPRAGDADLRLVEVLVPHADRAEHAAGGGALHPVGDVARARLHVGGGGRGAGSRRGGVHAAESSEHGATGPERRPRVTGAAA